MLQDIAPHRYDVAYRKSEVRETDVMLVFRKGQILCKVGEDGIRYPAAGDVIKAVPDSKEEARYLFRVDDCSYFGLEGAEGLALEGFSYLPTGQLRDARPVWKVFAGITGFQIHTWQMGSRFCGRCGSRMEEHGGERAMRCVTCKTVSYPVICPSVIVGILNGDQILMTKYARRHSAFQKYALVAGYVEVGESLEDAVRREVMEEVGLRVKNIRYYKSQPWPFTGALLAGFFCEVDGDAAITLDKGELSEARWFDREHIPAERSEGEISLTGEMIDSFKCLKKGGESTGFGLYCKERQTEMKIEKIGV